MMNAVVKRSAAPTWRTAEFEEGWLRATDAGGHGHKRTPFTYTAQPAHGYKLKLNARCILNDAVA